MLTVNRNNGHQCSHWMVTKFNISVEDFQQVIASSNAKYAVWQLERCPETGRDHIQGYVEFKRSVRFSTVTRLLGHEGLHIEPRRGSRTQAREYCQKELSRVAGPWEFGEWTIDQRGHRSDLEDAKKMLDEGSSMEKVADECFGSWVKYHKAFEKYQQYKKPKPATRDVRVYVLWGPTGTGKTHRAIGYDKDYYIITRPAQPNMPLWFDGYEGQTTIIIDEFYGWIPFDFLLRLLDKYRLQLQIRGGFQWAEYITVFITSNISPDDWYRGVPMDRRAALFRRLTKVVEVKSVDQPIQFLGVDDQAEEIVDSD